MKKLRNLTILTVSLLSLNAVEEVLIYKLNHVISNDFFRTLILLAMFGFGFVFVAGILVPWFRNVFSRLHTRSRREAGYTGIVLMYVFFFTVFFLLYHVIYTRGPQYLLPVAWR